MATIATYEVQVADLLHDPSNLIWSTTQLDRYINEARRQVAMDTGCLRSLQTVYFTQNVEAYTFGSVTGASITSGGSSYVAAAVGFGSDGGGSGVAATLGVSSGAVTSISFTNFGSGYTSAPTASIVDNLGSVMGVTITAIGTGFTSAPNVVFTPVSGGSGAAANCNLQVASVVVSNAGAGYTVGDVLTAMSGVPITPFQVKVSTVNGSGGVTAVTLSNAGNYSTPLVAALSMEGGTGSGCRITPTWGAGPITMVSAGSGYIIAPAVSLTGGGGGSGFTANAVIQGGVGASIAVGALNVNTYDVLDVHIVYGNLRYATQWYPWSVFARKYRGYTAVQQRPVAWATYGLTQIYLGPLPDQTYQANVDTVILPTDISGGTVDPIPPVVQDPIKFYAAFLAKYNAQMYGEAATFRQAYTQRLLEVAQPYTRRMGNVYWQGV